MKRSPHRATAQNNRTGWAQMISAGLNIHLTRTKWHTDINLTLLEEEIKKKSSVACGRTDVTPTMASWSSIVGTQ
jgi:hypothetical protein